MKISTNWGYCPVIGKFSIQIQIQIANSSHDFKKFVPVGCVGC